MTYVNIAHEDWATRGNYGLYGGRGEWRDNAFLNSSSYIGDDSKEVIPVFAANRMIPWRPGRQSWQNYYPGIEKRMDLLGEKNFLVKKDDIGDQNIIMNCMVEGLIGTRLRAAFQTQLTAHLTRNGRKRHYYTNDVTEISDEDLGTLIANSIEEVKKDFQDNMESSTDYGLPESNSGVSYGWPQYWRYKDLIAHFVGGSGWSSHHTRTWINGNVVKYLVGSYFLADISSTANSFYNITPLVCLVTKPKYMEYIRWSMALGKEVDHRIFQIWIHPEFDVPRSRWRGLRPLVRKHFLIPMYDAGVPVIKTDNFMKLFKNYDPPKLNNIRDYRKWLMDCSIESINNIKSNLK